jgi:hypothetical protein
METSIWIDFSQEAKQWRLCRVLTCIWHFISLLSQGRRQEFFQAGKEGAAKKIYLKLNLNRFSLFLHVALGYSEYKKILLIFIVNVVFPSFPEF